MATPSVAPTASRSGRILEEIAAGAVPRFSLTPGTASRIMTGCTDSRRRRRVVPVEQTELIDVDTVRLQQIDPAARTKHAAAGRRDAYGRHRAAARRRDCARLKSPSWRRPGSDQVPVSRGHDWRFCRPATSWLHVGLKPGSGQIRNSNGADAGRRRVAQPKPTLSNLGSPETTATSSRAKFDSGSRRTSSSSAAAYPPASSTSCRKCSPSSASSKSSTKSPCARQAVVVRRQARGWSHRPCFWPPRQSC